MRRRRWAPLALVVALAAGVAAVGAAANLSLLAPARPSTDLHVIAPSTTTTVPGSSTASTTAITAPPTPSTTTSVVPATSSTMTVTVPSTTSTTEDDSSGEVEPPDD